MRMCIFLGLVVLSMGSRLCPDHVKEQDIIDTCSSQDPVIYSVITDKNSFCLAAVRVWGCIHDNWSGCFLFQGGTFVPFIQITQQVCMEHFDAYHTTTDGGRCVGQGTAVNYQELSAKCPISHPALRAVFNHTDICKNFRRVINCAKRRFPSCPEMIKNAFTFYPCEGVQEAVEEIRVEEVVLKEIRVEEGVLNEIRAKIDQLVKEVSNMLAAIGEYGSHEVVINPQKVFNMVVELKAGLDELSQVFSVKIPRLVVGGYVDGTLHSGNANQSTYDNVESPRTEVRTHPRRRTVQTRSNASSEQASDSIKLSINLSIPLP